MSAVLAFNWPMANDPLCTGLRQFQERLREDLFARAIILSCCTCAQPAGQEAQASCWVWCTPVHRMLACLWCRQPAPREHFWPDLGRLSEDLSTRAVFLSSCTVAAHGGCCQCWVDHDVFMTHECTLLYPPVVGSLPVAMDKKWPAAPSTADWRPTRKSPKARIVRWKAQIN